MSLPSAIQVTAVYCIHSPLNICDEGVSDGHPSHERTLHGMLFHAGLLSEAASGDAWSHLCRRSTAIATAL